MSNHPIILVVWSNHPFIQSDIIISIVIISKITTMIIIIIVRIYRYIYIIIYYIIIPSTHFVMFHPTHFAPQAPLWGLSSFSPPAVESNSLMEDIAFVA